MQEGREQVLVVDDDQRVRRLLQRYLNRNGMEVHQAENGREMRQVLSEQSIDMILLDLVMPSEDGLALAKEVRQHSDMPIIMLTGRSDIVDKVVGLEVGADDYVTKPFDERELLARVKTVLRRNKAGTANPSGMGESTKLSFDGWVLNCDAHELQDPQGQTQHLTKHEFLLLEAFLQRPNRIWSRNEILDLVAGREWQASDRSIDVLVGKLRKKLEKDPKNPIYVHTVRGVGYKFSA